MFSIYLIKKLKEMKINIIFLLICASLFSCNNEMEEVSPAGNGEQDGGIHIEKIDAGKAQQVFAQILSKAVYNNTEVREFLKSEAIKQFDNDYDVFYPFIKDKKVTEDKTFRDILLTYCEDEKTLLEIEETLPLLNILVPDLTYVGDFNAENWDTSDNEVAVSFVEGNNESVLFADGESLDILKPGEIPGFPVLVVKNNERLKMTAATKAAGASNCSYEFISDAYNGQLRPQTKSQDEINLNPEIEDDFMPASSIDASIIQAYEESKSNPAALDRDFIYYGLCKAHPKNGVLNTNIRECLYKFKIDFNKYSIIADQDEDPHLQDVVNKKSELSNAEVISRIWTNGNFEMCFDAFIGSGKQASVQSHSIQLSVTPHELFNIDKIHVNYRHSTKFRHSKYTYWVDAKDLKPKWVLAKKSYMDNLVFTAPWDLANNSLNIILVMYEKDNSETITRTETASMEFANSSNFSASNTSGSQLNKLDVGISSKTSHSTTITITQTKESDALGRLMVNFSDPIILGEMTKNGVKGYRIFTVNNGAVEVMMLPQKMR